MRNDVVKGNSLDSRKRDDKNIRFVRFTPKFAPDLGIVLILDDQRLHCQGRKRPF
jgi:hypothetical protein